MKKILLLLFFLIVIPLAYFFITKQFNFGSGLNTGPVTLTYWGVEQDESSLKPLIDKYQKSHPNITINYKKLSLNRYRETVASRISEQKGPDIFRFHNTWVPMFKNILAPVPSSVMDDKVIRTLFYPIVDQDLMVSGKLLGVPLDFDGLALFINTAYFSQAGFATPPENWYEFREMAKKMTVRDNKGQILVGGAALGTSNNVDYFSDILGMMFLQNGTTMVSKGVVGFAASTSADKSKSNLGADALSFYSLFANTDHVWDRTLPNSLAAFEAGKAAMVFAPASKLPEIIAMTKAANPPVAFKVVNVPSLPNQPKVTWGSFWAEGVSNKSAHQKEAWDFVNFLVQKESLEERFNLTSRDKSMGLPFSRMDMKSEQISNPYLGAFVDQAPSAQSWYLAGNTFDNGLNDKIIAFFTTAVNSVQGSGSAVSALQAAVPGVTDVLVGYNLANPIPKPK